MKNYFKAMPSLTRFIVFSFAVVIIYSIAEFIISTITGVHHDVLTASIYGGFCGETLWCAIIKVFKLKEEDKDANG